MPPRWSPNQGSLKIPYEHLLFLFIEFWVEVVKSFPQPDRFCLPCSKRPSKNFAYLPVIPRRTCHPFRRRPDTEENPGRKLLSGFLNCFLCFFHSRFKPFLGLVNGFFVFAS